MKRATNKTELLVLRVDELPLLYSVIESFNLKGLINQQITLHGNWLGSSPGEILSVWLCYLLRECDHRISDVEEWVEERIELFQVLTKNPELRSLDFSDDKLGFLLELFSTDEIWLPFETALNTSLLSVYRIDELKEKKMSTIRIDAAPMQGYGQISADGLLQYGHHKHHANLPQFKIKLCTLDNELNHFGYPLCHTTVSGNTSDDVLYVDAIKNVKLVLKDIPSYESGNLYVGDSKFGSIGNRSYVVRQKDYYLMPLSLIQLSKTKRVEIIQKYSTDKKTYTEVYRTEKQEKVLVAKGFEEVITLKHEEKDDNGVVIPNSFIEWKERRLFVHSVAYAKVKKRALGIAWIKYNKNLNRLVFANKENPF
jgi:transposase